MSIEIPSGRSHADIWEREELIRRTKEFCGMRDTLAPTYFRVAQDHLTQPWQLISYADAEGFALRLRWSNEELPPANDAVPSEELPPHSFLEVNASHGTCLLHFVRRNRRGEMFIQSLSPDMIGPNAARIEKALVADLRKPLDSTFTAPSGWISTHPMSLWLPEDVSQQHPLLSP